MTPCPWPTPQRADAASPSKCWIDVIVCTSMLFSASTPPTRFALTYTTTSVGVAKLSVPFARSQLECNASTASYAVVKWF